METEYRRKARLVLGMAIGVNFLGGLLYIWSVINKGLMTEFHWTSSQASLPYTVAMMSFVVAMVLLGKLQDTKGPRICATLGGLLIGSGLILSGLTTNPALDDQSCSNGHYFWSYYRSRHRNIGNRHDTACP